VKFANKKQVPFLAYNGVHGALTSLGKMDHGVGISMSQLSSVKVNEDGKTATISGGTMSKLVTDELWAAGKQTVTGTCECVSLLGPALGGGHGWLQGHHGLVADQFVSMNVVLANGTLVKVDTNSDLWWAMKGAGHNFGIVTSLTTKVYDIEHTDWAIETITFSGDKVEAVYQAANDYLIKNGTQPVDIINWSYWMNNADADPNVSSTQHQTHSNLTPPSP
jgi:FAD/FMN-containing dehydrogenase